VNGDSPNPSELAPTGIDALPSARIIGLVVLALWLALHVYAPLSYYLSDDVYDERFAWRMFSAVRVQDCSVDARETVSGSERPIALQSVLPAPWVSLLQRDRPAVVTRFLTWRCASEAHPDSVSVVHACRSASGDALPPEHHVITCSSRRIEVTHD
jgi:hypothetical protein